MARQEIARLVQFLARRCRLGPSLTMRCPHKALTYNELPASGPLLQCVADLGFPLQGVAALGCAWQDAARSLPC